MIITIEQYQDIITAGAGFVLDSTAFTFKQLGELAVAAQAARVTLTLKNVSSISASHLKQLAVLAPGFLVIDLT